MTIDNTQQQYNLNNKHKLKSIRVVPNLKQIYKKSIDLPVPIIVA